MRQRGFILVTSLIFLVLMTLLGLSLFGSFNTNQTISGNFREKQRAEDAAQAAVNYAEYWLNTQAMALSPAPPPQGIACGTTSNPTPTTPVVCTQALPVPLPAALPLTTTTVPGAASYPAPAAAGTYSSSPMYYIQFLYQQAGGVLGALTCPCSFYKITAAANGGNSNAASIIQTVYIVGSGTGSRSGGYSGG